MQRRIEGFDFEGINPDHPTAGSEGDGGEGKKFLQEAAKIGNGDALSKGRIGDEKGDAARSAAGDFQKIPKIFLDEVCTSP
jgi:hypothetical protein